MIIKFLIRFRRKYLVDWSIWKSRVKDKYFMLVLYKFYGRFIYIYVVFDKYWVMLFLVVAVKLVLIG